MTMTSSGPLCDVCGKYIFPFPGESVNAFTVEGISAIMVCHNACKPHVLAETWVNLPDGPLRQAHIRVNEGWSEPIRRKQAQEDLA